MRGTRLGDVTGACDKLRYHWVRMMPRVVLLVCTACGGALGDDTMSDASDSGDAQLQPDDGADADADATKGYCSSTSPCFQSGAVCLSFACQDGMQGGCAWPSYPYTCVNGGVMLACGNPSSPPCLGCFQVGVCR
jgi:hypothetical protein